MELGWFICLSGFGLGFELVQTLLLAYFDEYVGLHVFPLQSLSPQSKVVLPYLGNKRALSHCGKSCLTKF